MLTLYPFLYILFGYHILNAVTGNLDHRALIDLHIDHVVFDLYDLSVDASPEEDLGSYLDRALEIFHVLSALLHIA